MRPTKILFISHSALWFGAETCLFTLLQGLNRAKFEPIVAFPEEGILKEKVEALGIRAFVVAMRRWVWSPHLGPGQRGQFSRGLGERVDAIARLMRQEGVDLAFTNTSVVVEGALAAHSLGIPHVWHVLEMLGAHPEFPFPIQAGDFYSLMNGLSDKIVLASESVKAHIGGLLPADKLEVIFHGVGPMSERPSRRPELFGIGESAPVILFVGSVSDRKGVMTLADSAPAVLEGFPGAKFVIAGSDQGVQDAMRARLRDRGIDGAFLFLGFRTDVPDLMASADVVAVPSLSDPLPLVVLEAMAAAKPVAATRSGGAAEMVIDGETGYLVPVKDPRAMGRALRALLADPERREAMGRRGLARVRASFSLERYLAGFERVLADAASGAMPDASRRDDLLASLSASFGAAEPAAPRLDFVRTRPQGEGSSGLPLVSVVIPSYNHAEYVLTALRSALDQTYPRVEVLVVDDGSTDGSERVIGEYLEKSGLDRVRSFRRPHGDAASAINFGLEQARGELLTVLNSDDYYRPGRIARLVDRHRELENEKGSVGVLFSALGFVDAAGRDIPSDWLDRAWSIREEVPSLGFVFLTNNVAMTSGNLFFDRRLHREVGGFREFRHCHDLDFILRTVVSAEPEFVPEDLLAYRLHGRNTIRQPYPNSESDNQRIVREFIRSVNRAKPANPLCPSPENWIGYFDYFVGRYRPWFGDRTIAEVCGL